MAYLGPRQAQIIKFIKDNGGEATKKEMVVAFDSWYYANVPHNLGLVLSNMVKRRLLIRVKRGVFQVGDGKKLAKQIDKNQIKLF